MGRSKIYISHSEEFELVSPTRVLSSGYLFLLFKYKGSVGGFIWNDCSNYSYAYDSISGNYVVTARVHENISYFDNDWGNDTDPETWNSVVSFLELHNITYTVDASNVVNRTPSINPRMHGYRCSGYHLINIPCTFMTEDDARSGFKKDAARWKIESNIMDDAYKNETERRKKKGIEKRKVTMALKREERERTTSNTEITEITSILTNKFKLTQKDIRSSENTYMLQWTGLTSMHLYVHATIVSKVITHFKKQGIKASYHISKRAWNKCISIKNVIDTIIKKPNDIITHVDENVNIYSTVCKWLNTDIKSIPRAKQLIGLITKFTNKSIDDFYIRLNRYSIVIIPITEHIKWTENESSWEAYTRQLNDYNINGHKEDYEGSNPIQPELDRYQEPEKTIADIELVDSIVIELTKNNINAIKTLTSDECNSIIISDDLYNTQWMDNDILNITKASKKISDKIKKGIKKVTNAFNIDESKVVDPTNIKIMFGKYNGRLLGDMNTNEEINYLNWLCNTFTQNILTNTHKPTKFYYALKTKCKQVQHT